jgi:enoyl-CoA hydratase
VRSTLSITRSRHAVVIAFTRPELRNPLSVDVLARIETVVSECGDDASVRGVVFTGRDGVFASGADLREIAAVGAGEAVEFAQRGQKLMNTISGIPQTTVAAINGYCFGGALDLALACDRRIASPDAMFAHPGTGLGIITGWGGTQRLPRLIGTGNAIEIFFTASPIDAARARRIGLVDEVAGDPLARALEFVESSGFSDNGSNEGATR